jgi:hypothetical protein
MDSVGSLPAPPAEKRFDPRWKVFYLLAVTAGAMAAPPTFRPFIVPGLVLLQVVLLRWLRVRWRDIWGMTTRLRGLFLFLLGCYILLPAPEGNWVVRLSLGFRDWFLPVNLTGLGLALLMCGQIIAVILASAVVRLSGAETDLVDGLRKLWCPRLFVYSIDNTLSLLGGFDRLGGRGRGDGSGGGKGRAGPGPGFLVILRRLLQGDVGFLVDSIKSGMDQAAERTRRTMDPAVQADPRLVHDVTIISGIALLMMSMKLLKILPGVAFASGHKSLIMVPLYILAAQLTYTRFGATTAGAIMGLLGYLNGDGRYGVLEVFKHVIPGLVIDLLWPLFRRLPLKHRTIAILAYSFLGTIAALCRLSTEIALALLLGARWEVYFAFTWRVLTSLTAGALSGAVTYVLLLGFGGMKAEQAVKGGSSPPISPSPIPEPESLAAVSALPRNPTAVTGAASGESLTLS